jgi:hypothetical protein
MKEHYPDWEKEARGMLESISVNYDFGSDAPEFTELMEGSRYPQQIVRVRR